ncbi:MAG: helix-turn-helix transcriptional regulator [Desulfovibrionaceae bacterium]|nr:helix-turn-helix transcriptional regulator [Desulfovibrionaceae bacterium]
MEEAAALFKVLGDATRMRILLALAREELCVCDLSELLAMTQSAISHQLRVLRAARIVRSRRDGKMVFYALDDAHIERLVAAALDHVRE